MLLNLEVIRKVITTINIIFKQNINQIKKFKCTILYVVW